LIVTHLEDFSAAAPRIIATRFFIDPDASETAQATEKEDQFGLFELWPASPDDGLSKIRTRVEYYKPSLPRTYHIVQLPMLMFRFTVL
jgi:hypothetical protein